jgi:hypothetical protein
MSSQTEDPDLETWQTDAKTLWIRVLVAANKLLAIGVAILMHKVLDVAAAWVAPAGWEKAILLLRGIFFAAFSIVYVHFVWEMLTTFVPSMGSRSLKVREAAHAEPEIATTGE